MLSIDTANSNCFTLNSIVSTAGATTIASKSESSTGSLTSKQAIGSLSTSAREFY